MDDEPNKHLTYTKVCAVYSVQRAHVVCKETCTETDGKCLAKHFYRLKIIIIIKKIKIKMLKSHGFMIFVISILHHNIK